MQIHSKKVLNIKTPLCHCLKNLSETFLFFKGSYLSLLPINEEETFYSNPLFSSPRNYWKRYYYIRMSLITTKNVIFLLRSKFLDCLTYILLQTSHIFVEKNTKFITAGKFVTSFISSISSRNIEWSSFTFRPIWHCLPLNWQKFS